MKKKENILIEVLQDKTANLSERDDAAMDLSEFDSPEVIKILLEKGSDQSEDPIILNSCGESLAEIWIRNNFFDIKSYDSLQSTAQKGALFVIKSAKPVWVEMYRIKA